MASIIVCLANDGQFQKITVDAHDVKTVGDDTLILQNEFGDTVASFKLWAWYAVGEHTQVSPE